MHIQKTKGQDHFGKNRGESDGSRKKWRGERDLDEDYRNRMWPYRILGRTLRWAEAVYDYYDYYYDYHKHHF